MMGDEDDQRPRIEAHLGDVMLDVRGGSGDSLEDVEEVFDRKLPDVVDTYTENRESGDMY
ncbi:hypothetical protein [Natronobacterium gregoryi]|uniref:Uncharacterized protein n=2 Tax=Natronobacterium gregoryi TaxID=44930 RepID=L0AIN5_NATGS|nr:hypothetical protein [Natronobacterium gregoryi]AFZ73037.1 hypothetical protein Natgr_1852 [Natronobacterium gregoryi SP2]SFI63024.1 hypothetical protein SAMN05443661_102229 [Natronobacterium gregoryi]